MFLQPKSVKYKKFRKSKVLKFEFRSNQLKFGVIGLKSVESGFITSRQIESARQAIMRKIKRRGKLWIRVFPSLSVTSKPNEVRMGKGKGPFSHWSARVSGGQMLFELCGNNIQIFKAAFKTGGAKLPIKTKICF